jgi:hypothetical protein
VTTSRQAAIASAVLDTYRRAGPDLATVYLPTPSRTADASQKYEQRSKLALKQLAEMATSPQLNRVVADALEQRSHGEGEALALVASDCELLFEHTLIRPVDRVFVAVSPAPQLLPLLAASRVDQAHVAVLIDRAGAEVWQRDGLGPATKELEVEGDTVHIHRSHPGGWSQRRYQQIAENTWDRNAKAVVDEMIAAFPEGPLVIVGGDVRAVGFFVEHLPARLQPALVVEGSRSADPDAFLDQVDVAVRTVAAEELAAEIRDLREAAGQGEVWTGLQALTMLSQGLAGRLYVANDTFADHREEAQFAFGLPTVAGTAGMPPIGPNTRPAPLSDGAVVLAAATGAEVTVVPETAIAPLGGPVLVTARGRGQ